MAEEFQEKSEQATPRKRQKAKEKGQVGRSKDLTSMIAMSGIVMLLYFGGEYFFNSLAEMTGGILSFQYGRDPMYVAKAAVIRGAYILAPFFLCSIVLVVVGSVSQGGFVTKPMKLEISKINPLQGIKKIFSMQGVTEFLKSFLKFAVGGWVVFFILKKDSAVLPTLSTMEINQIAKEAGSLIMEAVIIASSLYMLAAIIGAVLEKKQHERSLKMTKQEIKEEHKEAEGDPLIKSRIRSVQREASRKRMMQEVETATVVITNPTHLAVAIRYEENESPAPKVVAKGAGHVAAKIREIARKHGVPIIEDRPLARSLFKLDLNAFIPEELYVAVARILAHIYKLRGKV
jgi:flagellar biosynthetic protein FlhB